MLKRLLLVALIAAAIVGFFAFDFQQYLTLSALKAHQHELASFIDANFITAFVTYLLLYVLVTALSLPGAVVLTLGAGALFGLGWGLLLVSFASTFGATLAFLTSRFLLHDWVNRKFSNKLKAINKGMARDGAFYLLSLRLVPLFPFFVINLVMGVTSIRLWTYYWVSQVGMLAGTAVYVNAGTQLGQVRQIGDIVSGDLILSFVLLGLFPLIAKWLLDLLKRRKAYQGWQKPKTFDRNLVVIGGGSAGLVSAYIAAAVKARVTLVEKDKMGGDCLNSGCVPSKALLHASKMAALQDKAAASGVHYDKPRVDFAAVMERVKQVIKTIEPNDSVERYTKLGVDVVQGEAEIVSPWQVDIHTNKGTQSLTTRNIIIATGARPFVPDLPGLDQVDYLTSDNLWQLRELPDNLVVLGGGPIGCELSQAFARLGSKVTQVEMAGRLLGKEDPDASEVMKTQLEKDGVNVHTASKAVEVITDAQGQPALVVEKDGERQTIGFDKLLIAVGRQANLTGYGLDKLNIKAERTILTNELLQTQYPNIFAVGDVAGPYQFTHTASHQAWYGAVNALFQPLKTFKVDYSVIPWATFTEPEVATVGLNETAASEQGLDYEVTRYDLGELDRALADDHASGFVKVLTVPGKDKILGATIVGAQAGELIAEFVLAMKHGIGLNKILGTIHIYPTMSEANKYAAGNWKRANAPEKVLNWLERFHRWRR